MDVIAVLQNMINLPMAAGTNLNNGDLMFDKRVCAAFQKKTAVMAGLARIGMEIVGAGLNTPQGNLALGVFGLVHTILVPLKRALGFRVMPFWSSMRYGKKEGCEFWDKDSGTGPNRGSLL